jgi:hypothetical protein
METTIENDEKFRLIARSLNNKDLVCFFLNRGFDLTAFVLIALQSHTHSKKSAEEPKVRLST